MATPWARIEVVQTDQGDRRVLDVVAGRVVIGRGNAADLQLPYGALSRAHFELEFRDGGTWLRDLGSTNGTIVCGETIARPVKLRDGDHIIISGTILRFHYVHANEASVFVACCGPREGVIEIRDDGGWIGFRDDNSERVAYPGASVAWLTKTQLLVGMPDRAAAEAVVEREHDRWPGNGLRFVTWFPDLRDRCVIAIDIAEHCAPWSGQARRIAAAIEGVLVATKPDGTIIVVVEAMDVEVLRAQIPGQFGIAHAIAGELGSTTLARALEELSSSRVRYG